MRLILQCYFSCTNQCEICMRVSVFIGLISLTIIMFAPAKKSHATDVYFLAFYSVSRGFISNQGAACLIRNCILLTIMPFAQDHHKYYITCRFFTVFSRVFEDFHIKIGYGMHACVCVQV